MKTNIEHFTPVGTEQLLEINGGGFAYDVGRVLRFLSFLPGKNPYNNAMAIVDWHVNKLINEAEN